MRFASRPRASRSDQGSLGPKTSFHLDEDDYALDDLQVSAERSRHRPQTCPQHTLKCRRERRAALFAHSLETDETNVFRKEIPRTIAAAIDSAVELGSRA